MRPRAVNSTLLLLAATSVAGAIAADIVDPPKLDAIRDVPTKNAPVDGKDGVPHTGPFVPTDAEVDTEHPGLEGRLDDVTGEELPTTNDGVMFDKNRERAEEGTTGLAGGVTAKEKERKAEEAATGEKPVAQPESPKERPPLPHSEEEKIKDSPGGLDETLIPDVRRKTVREVM